MKRVIVLLLSVSTVLLAGTSILAGDDGKPTATKGVAPLGSPLSSVLHLKHCKLEFHETTRLGSPLSSFLQDLLVNLGDSVKGGQVVGRLFDKEVRAQLDQFALKAESDIAIELARTDLSLAQTKLAKTESLEKRSFASNEVLIEDRYLVQKARIALSSAEFDKQLARIDQERLKGEARARELVAPHDGVVVEILKNQGESLLVGDPVLRIVNPKRLKVWGSVNVPDLWRIKLGQPVRVSADIPGVELEIEREVFEGRIVFISSEVDKETQTCQVLALIDNRDDLLKGGLLANMDISLTDDPTWSKEKPIQPSVESKPRDPSPKPIDPSPKRTAAAKRQPSPKAGQSNSTLKPNPLVK